ncbi:hypothetical protein K438DRAFT_2066849 [Mycena galopus ATCC 62051]|nr:hypothetical protein K438DRAFT_2066849 [Mycena galopus ATCC 62051]
MHVAVIDNVGLFQLADKGLDPRKAGRKVEDTSKRALLECTQVETAHHAEVVAPPRGHGRDQALAGGKERQAIRTAAPLQTRSQPRAAYRKQRPSARPRRRTTGAVILHFDTILGQEDGRRDEVSLEPREVDVQLLESSLPGSASSAPGIVGNCRTVYAERKERQIWVKFRRKKREMRPFAPGTFAEQTLVLIAEILQHSYPASDPLFKPQGQARLDEGQLVPTRSEFKWSGLVLILFKCKTQRPERTCKTWEFTRDSSFDSSLGHRWGRRFFLRLKFFLLFCWLSHLMRSQSLSNIEDSPARDKVMPNSLAVSVPPGARDVSGHNGNGPDRHRSLPTLPPTMSAPSYIVMFNKDATAKEIEDVKKNVDKKGTRIPLLE